MFDIKVSTFLDTKIVHSSHSKFQLIDQLSKISLPFNKWLKIIKIYGYS